LHDAALSDNLEVADWLIEHGANVNVKGLLDAAAASGSPKMVQWLKEHGAK